MRIIILTQYYPPEHGAPQNRLHDLARRWRAAGEDVHVLAAMPNYPKGEVFDGYRGRLACRDTVDGVPVLRSWIWPARTKGVLRQLAAYLSFTASAGVVGVFGLGQADVLLCESPPLFLGATALMLAFRTQAKLVMNISDLWPESAVQMGLLGRGPSLSILEWFEGFLYRRSALVTCQTEGIVAGVTARAPGARAFLFPNGVDLDTFKPVPRNPALAARLGLPAGQFIVGYGGNHGRAQGLRQLLDAAELLRGRPIAFALFGDGAEKDELVAEAARRRLDAVRFHPSAPRTEMADIQALWDAAVVPLRDLPLFDGARPSKMFELMAGGIPFIFCGKGEGAAIAAASGGAVVVPPERPSELAAAIERLAATPAAERAAMGMRGAAYVLEHFNRERLAAKLLAEIKGLAGNTAKRAVADAMARFTLVELLLVVGILGVLLGLLLPAMSSANAAGRSASCLGNLRQIGIAVQEYIKSSDGIMPAAATLPSANLTTDPRICDVLSPFLSGSTKVFRCPSDPGGKYFASEGSSYEYNGMLAGRKLGETRMSQRWGEGQVIIMYDYEPFHGKPGTPGSTNFLFGDGHAGDLK